MLQQVKTAQVRFDCLIHSVLREYSDTGYPHQVWHFFSNHEEQRPHKFENLMFVHKIAALVKVQAMIRKIKHTNKTRLQSEKKGKGYSDDRRKSESLCQIKSYGIPFCQNYFRDTTV